MPARYGSSGGLLQPSTTGLFLSPQAPMRLLNPYGGRSMLGGTPHQQQQLSNSVPYNPYSVGGVDARVMARPAIEPMYSSHIQPSVVTAMQRAREPSLYSSVSSARSRGPITYTFGLRTERTSAPKSGHAHHVHTAPVDSAEVTAAGATSTAEARSTQYAHQSGQLAEGGQQQWTALARHSNDFGGL